MKEYLKSDLIKDIQKEENCNQKQALHIMQTVLDSIMFGTMDRGAAKLQGFGRFHISIVKSRQAKDLNGKVVTMPEGVTVRFTCGAEFKRRVKDGNM